MKAAASDVGVTHSGLHAAWLALGGFLRGFVGMTSPGLDGIAAADSASRRDGASGASASRSVRNALIEQAARRGRCC